MYFRNIEMCHPKIGSQRNLSCSFLEELRAYWRSLVEITLRNIVELRRIYMKRKKAIIFSPYKDIICIHSLLRLETYMKKE